MFLCLIVFQQYDGQMGVQMLDEGFDKVEFDGCHGLFFRLRLMESLFVLKKIISFFFFIYIFFNFLFILREIFRICAPKLK